MAKKAVVTKIKLQCPGGQATPAPPVGPALGQHGVNIGQFVQQFNERTRDQQGMIIPAEITVYKDRSFEFILKSPPASALLKQAAGIVVGSGEPNKTKIGRVTWAQVREIAEKKRRDLNASSVEAAMRIVEGTARSMGIEVVESLEGLPPLAPAEASESDAVAASPEVAAKTSAGPAGGRSDKA